MFKNRGYKMHSERVQRFYEELRKMRNSAGLEYSETFKTVFLYKEKYGLSCKEILDSLKKDMDKIDSNINKKEK